MTFCNKNYTLYENQESIMNKNDISRIAAKNAWDMYLLFSQYSHYGFSPAPETTNQNSMAPVPKAKTALNT